MDKPSASNKVNKNFKFKELKVYSSTEWLADNKKKYRQVFDRYETTYVYVELSFYNKLFDQESWKVNINLKCYEIKNGKKAVCSLDFSRKINKYDNVVYIREGWGNKKEGLFWKKGNYCWEAWIDGQKVGVKYFYIEDTGTEWESVDNNPYFNLKSVKLYEGKYDDVIEEERKYLKAMSSEETRYVYSEIILENNFIGKDWFLELFVKYYNEARELKGQVIKLQSVGKDDDLIKISAGWGSNTPGSWRFGNYIVDIIFLNTLIASVPFEVDDHFVEGQAPVVLSYKDESYLATTNLVGDLTFEEVVAKLDNLIGLSQIKKKVKEHAQYIQFLKLRKEKGFDEEERINIHSVFIGNPGTGKTTVAKMMGAIYHKMGLLSKGHVHEVDRVDLVGEYIGQTAPKVKEALEKARGGVLFIDEAYALARANDDSKDFGREVIEILVKEMSSGDLDMAIIVAGYPKEMKHFIDSNPGLKSRFKHYYEFSDYLPQELAAIANFAAVQKDVIFTPEAKVALDQMITRAYRDRSKSFGNARYVFDLIEKAKINMALRVMASGDADELSHSELETLQLQDVLQIDENDLAVKPAIPVDQELLDLSLTELNEMIGIDSVKREIKDLVNIIQYHQRIGKDVLNKYFFHTVFVGNPGTGKTTVARILAKIFKALGLIERGHIVETDRQGLVAGFVGQTAMKTHERVEEAMGGVLFIDEAYALSNFNGLQGDYGNEAIQTLLKRMEDDRGQFFVFAAGYPENMDKFLKANPGLRSRFDKVLHFDDYTVEQLSEIATYMLIGEGYQVTTKAQKYIAKKCEELVSAKDKYFGNAREVRKLILDVIKQQNLRLAETEKQSGHNPKLISAIDIETATIHQDKSLFQSSSIGFNSAK